MGMGALAMCGRTALKTLARNPRFTATVMLTLGLGLGATTAVYSLANWLLLRPVPGVANPDRVVTIRFRHETRPGGWFLVSHPDLEDLRSATPALEALGATHGYFRALGVRPTSGRLPMPAEGEDPRLVMLSDRVWREAYGADPEVVGTVMTINGEPFTITGVARPGFRGPRFPESVTDLWLPVEAHGTGLLLGLGGGAAGLALAAGLLRLFEGTRLLPNFPALDGVSLDHRVLLFAVAVSVATGLLFALLPALMAARSGDPALRAGDGVTVRGGRLRTALVTGQVAISLALVVAAGLLLDTVRSLNDVALGFDPAGVVEVTVDPGTQGFGDERRVTFWKELVDAARSVPGVVEVGLAWAPLHGRTAATPDSCPTGPTPPRRAYRPHRTTCRRASWPRWAWTWWRAGTSWAKRCWPWSRRTSC